MYVAFFHLVNLVTELIPDAKGKLNYMLFHKNIFTNKCIQKIPPGQVFHPDI